MVMDVTVTRMADADHLGFVSRIPTARPE